MFEIDQNRIEKSTPKKVGLLYGVYAVDEDGLHDDIVLEVYV